MTWSKAHNITNSTSRPHILSILLILTAFNLYSGTPRMGLSVNNKQKVRQAVVKILRGGWLPPPPSPPPPLARYVLNRNGLTLRGVIFMTEEEKFLTVKSLKPGPGVLK